MLCKDPHSCRCYLLLSDLESSQESMSFWSEIEASDSSLSGYKPCAPLLHALFCSQANGSAAKRQVVSLHPPPRVLTHSRGADSVVLSDRAAPAKDCLTLGFWAVFSMGLTCSGILTPFSWKTEWCLGVDFSIRD